MNRTRYTIFSVLLLLGMSLPGMVGCASTASVHEHRLEVPEGTRMLAVDVENFRGVVEVRGDRGQEGTALVRAEVVTAWDADKATRGRVSENVDVSVEVVEEEPGLSVLRVRTDKSIAGYEHGVRIYIETPRIDGTRIVNQGGYVEVVGVRGGTHIENRFGMIELRTDHPLTEDVTILNTDGPILVRMPPGSTGIFDLETLEGESSMRDESGDLTEMKSTHETLHTVLGGGTNMVLARTNLGDVRVWVTKDAEAYSRLIKQTMPDVRSGLFLDGSRRHTRNLPDDEPRRNPAVFDTTDPRFGP